MPELPEVENVKRICLTENSSAISMCGASVASGI